MPRPPPPAAALTTSGKPISSGAPAAAWGRPPRRRSASPRACRRREQGPLRAARPRSIRLRPPPRRRRRSPRGSRNRDGRRRSGLARGPEVLGRVEIAGDHRRRIRRPRVERAEVVRRDDRDRLDTARPARAEDAERDLAPVGDEQPADHGVSPTSRGAGARDTRASPPDPRRSYGAPRSAAPSRARRVARERGVSRDGRPGALLFAARPAPVLGALEIAVTSLTRPIRSAVAASKRSPVTK